MATNCWQFKGCGREPGGPNVAELGVCSATQAKQHNETNSGKNAGRYCWKVAGTLCGGKVQGTYAQKLMNCVACEFYKSIRQEQGSTFVA